MTTATNDPIEHALTTAKQSFGEDATLYQQLMRRSHEPEDTDGEQLAGVVDLLGMNVEDLRRDATNLTSYRRDQALIDAAPDRADQRAKIQKEIAATEAERAKALSPFDRKLARLADDLTPLDHDDDLTGQPRDRANRAPASGAYGRVVKTRLRLVRVLADVDTLQAADFDPSAPRVRDEAAVLRQRERLHTLHTKPITEQQRVPTEAPKMREVVVDKGYPRGLVCVGVEPVPADEIDAPDEGTVTTGIGFGAEPNPADIDDDEASE